MKISSITVKLFGKKETVFRVLNASGEVVHVATDAQSAQAWIDAQ